MVPSEQSADLRRYYNKHTKIDRLDCELLARLPLLHPDGLLATPGLGPAEALRRTVGHRESLVTRRTGVLQRLDALLELLGPGWTAALATDPGKAALAVLAVLKRYADPHALQRLSRARLTRLLIRASRGAWREDKADALLAAARESLTLWSGGGIDFAELAEDIGVEARLIRQLTAEIEQLDDRIATHYEASDPTGIVASAPGVGAVLALVPKVSQSGTVDRHDGPTTPGDHVLRYALFMAADHARKTDPTLAARYQRLRAAGKHTTARCAPSAPSWSPASPPAGATTSTTSCATSTPTPSPTPKAAPSAR